MNSPDRQPDIETLQSRLREALAREQEAARRHAEELSRLRHDINGALSPALLTADRLLMAEDPKQKQAGERISTAIKRAAMILQTTKT